MGRSIMATLAARPPPNLPQIDALDQPLASRSILRRFGGGVCGLTSARGNPKVQTPRCPKRMTPSGSIPTDKKSFGRQHRPNDFDLSEQNSYRKRNNTVGDIEPSLNRTNIMRQEFL